VTESRPLTEGETALARSVFRNAIDYARVRIVRGRWWPFQPRNVAMAPNGNIYFPPDGPLWSADFGAEPLHLQGLFIHEMTHVWQSQRWGKWYLLLMRHPFCRYRYTYEPRRPFVRYGIEQQAEIVRHVCLLRRGFAPPCAAPLPELDALISHAF
jgi:hypothetical protein